MNLELLTKLTQAFGPSGYEDEIRALIQEHAAPWADELRTDPLGNLIVHHRGNGQGEKIVLAAHMDEIGVMVSHVDKEGYLRFTRIGGVYPLHCIGSRVRFANGTQGVIYLEHREDASTSPKLTQLYIDVGAASKDDAPVSVGAPAAFVRPLVQQGTRLISKTLDDRIGCYILLELLQQVQDSPHDLYLLFSTQEEVGLRGARTAAFSINPDLAIAVDVTGTGDTPKALPMAVALGDGPAIKVQDPGMIAHPKVRQLLVEAARKAEVPYQLEVLRGGTTDAAAMQLTRAGIPSGTLSIPCRYVHSPSEMVDSQDVENAIKLLTAALA
ncbi:MAG: M42 family metallopeptidase [Chloroflexota bacterium]|nr:M42 family metallopeptidase [Chloroflexota bacterium]